MQTRSGAPEPLVNLIVVALAYQGYIDSILVDPLDNTILPSIDPPPRRVSRQGRRVVKHRIFKGSEDSKRDLLAVLGGRFLSSFTTLAWRASLRALASLFALMQQVQ